MSMIMILGIVFVLALMAGGAVMFAASKPAIGMQQNKALTDGRMADGSVDVLSAKITDVRAGGLIEAKGFGDEFEDQNLEIDSYNRMSFEKENWHELISQYKGRAVAVEWQERATGTVLVNVRFHRCKELQDIGLSDGDLDALADGKSVSADGQDFSFRRKGEALFHKGGEGFGKKFEFWEFEDASGGILRIERRTGDSATVSIGRATSEGEFGVLRVRGR